MEISKPNDSQPAPTQFAEGNTSEGSDLKARIMACLGNRLPDMQGIHITVFGGTAVVRGVWSSAQEKRLCLECCRHVPGVLRVLDELIVIGQSPSDKDREDKSS